MCIVIVGNPHDGFVFFGPFADWETAMEWGHTQHDGDWWICPLNDPKD